jgi:transcription initiation factor TFIIH subunit 1
MQPNSYDKVPILRTLNRMSEKMMEEVTPIDADRHGPAGMDEQTYKEIQLRDLQRDEGDNRVLLKIQDQAHLFASGQGMHTSSSASTYAERTPAEALSVVWDDFGNLLKEKNDTGVLNLEPVLGVQEDSSSDEEGSAKKRVKVGSGSARAAATTQIVKAIKKRHLHSADFFSFQNTASSQQASKLGLSQSVFNTLTMTHNTTVEFLHYFWAVYFSGDPDRASEVARLIETLDKSLDRIKAVADSAESERAAKVEQLTREYEAYTRRTGKKKKFDPNNIEGGAKAVNKVMSPLVRAIRSAKEQFERSLHEQLSLAAASASKVAGTV